MIQKQIINFLWNKVYKYKYIKYIKYKLFYIFLINRYEIKLIGNSVSI